MNTLPGKRRIGSFDFPRLANISDADIESFRHNGFLIIEGFLDKDRVTALQELLQASSTPGSIPTNGIGERE